MLIERKERLTAVLDPLQHKIWGFHLGMCPVPESTSNKAR